MVSVLQGHFHQGNIMSDGAGFQCTAIAFVALLMASLRNPNVHPWSASNIDEVVSEGHQLYEHILVTQNTQGLETSQLPRYLGHWEIPYEVLFGGREFRTTSYYDIFFGLVQTQQVNSTSVSDNGAVEVEQALQMAAQISDFMLVTFNQRTIAIFHLHDTENCEQWHIFDSHSLDSNGFTASEGFATLLSFMSSEELLNYIHLNYEGAVFNVSPVVIEDLNSQSTIAPESLQEISYEEINTYRSKAKCEKNKPKKDSTKRKKNHAPLIAEPVTDLPFYVMYESFEINNGNSSVDNRLSREFLAEQLDGKNSEIKKYEEQIRKIPFWHCNNCEKFLFEEQVKRLSKGDKQDVLNEENIYCSRCTQGILKGKMPSFSINNLLSTGHVPKCLQDLTFAERRMISQLQTYMTLVILPGGQYAEKGLAIHFPLDINSYFEELIACKNENFLILIPSSNSEVQTLSARKFINYDRVKNAISWLRLNNPLYKDFPDLACSESKQSSVHDNGSFASSIIHTVNSILESNNHSTVIPINYTVPDIDMEEAISSARGIHIPTQFNNPSWISQITHGEELAFPWLFPLGCGGLTENRPEKISVLDYFNTRLYNKDSRWRSDITYLMYAVNHMEQEKLSNNIEIQLRLRKPGNGQSFRAGDLLDMNNNPDIKPNSFMFLKNIRGTVAYWADILSNLLSTVKRLGPPTLFVTLSADDCNWPELKMILYKISYYEALFKGPCNDALRKDPLLASLFFERRWKALLKYILKGQENILGHIEDYFVRLEYQNRGSPHLHIFLWITGAPSVDRSSSEQIISYIDKVISTSVPSKDVDPVLHHLVTRLQTHHHTKTCLRKNICRFGFPRSEMSKTQILTNGDLTSPNKRGHFYETKRNKEELYINAYNPLLLKRWRANMDIQMVSGGTGLAYYVCTYIAKAEPDDLKEALCKTFQNINSQTYPFSLRKQMHLIGNCVLKARRLSAQEAAARIGHLQLVWSSRVVVFLNTRSPEKRFKVLRPKLERDELPTNSTDIFRTNILDYYVDRPDMLDNVSLFKFASWYALCPASEEVNGGPRTCERVRLKTLGKTFRKRKRFIVVRTPKFEPISDDYFYSLLMLHLPYRNENTLKHPYSTAEEAFIHKHELFDLEDMHYDSYLSNMERIVRQIRATSIDLGPIVAPNTDEGVENNDYSISNEHSHSSIENIISTENEYHDPDEVNFHSLQVNLLSEHELAQQIGKLTPDQLIIFSEIRLHFQLKCTTALRMFLTGGAGTGKSFLVRTIVEWLRLFTAPFSGADPVVVCGPTGMSAKTLAAKHYIQHFDYQCSMENRHYIRNYLVEAFSI